MFENDRNIHNHFNDSKYSRFGRPCATLGELATMAQCHCIDVDVEYIISA